MILGLRVAVTAGYGRSLHAIALLHSLAARGHEVVLCIQVRALNAGRLRGYLRQIGLRKLWGKIRAKLFASTGEYGGEIAAMQAFNRNHHVFSGSIADECGVGNVRHIVVNRLDDAGVAAAVRAARADLIVYAGGGIVRRELLQATRLGVLNAHGGPLPRFRGMNAAEWAWLHGVAPTVTIHWMNEGIDTGPILFERPIPTNAWKTIAEGRGTATRVGVEALLEAVDRVAAGNVPAMPQEVEAGRQYHVMADPLLEVLERRLRSANS